MLVGTREQAAAPRLWRVADVLWAALPRHLRALDEALEAIGAEPLPPTACPLSISSWMGGDRDGNPNVTADTTQHVLLLGCSPWFYRLPSALLPSLRPAPRSAAVL